MPSSAASWNRSAAAAASRSQASEHSWSRAAPPATAAIRARARRFRFRPPRCRASARAAPSSPRFAEFGMVRLGALVGDRLVVGRVALDHVAGVRILLPQPTNFAYVVAGSRLL